MYLKNKRRRKRQNEKYECRRNISKEEKKKDNEPFMCASVFIYYIIMCVSVEIPRR